MFQYDTFDTSWYNTLHIKSNYRMILEDIHLYALDDHSGKQIKYF